MLLYTFIITTTLVIVQVIGVDLKFTKKHPFLLLLYLPYQHLAPALFIGFTLAYLNSYEQFKKFRWAYFAPFIIFFLIYTLLKINILTDFSIISKKTAAFIQYEWDENSALTYSIFAGIINYRIILKYEKSLGELPHNKVIKKTQWIKLASIILIALSIIWLATLLYIKINPYVSGNTPYYFVWTLFLIFYILVFAFGSKHLKHLDKENTKDLEQLEDLENLVIKNGLDRVFTHSELLKMQQTNYEATAILNFFATSLFDKNKEDEVLWSIAENCISKLNLEDCVIYILDKEKQLLIQKAAYGNKANKQKILSPIKIKVGNGIVGSVAKTKKTELINNIDNDSRYIIDDCKRNSELAVPIIFEDTLFGVLDSEHSEHNFFTEKHVFLFELITKLTATKLNYIGKKVKTSITNDNAYYKELEKLMSKEKLYKNADLSLVSVAEMLHISSTYLSQLVNAINNSNFSDYINNYRIKEAKKMLTNAQYSKYTIVSIGLEAGFNSKSTFYNAFKKHTGKTPSEYKEKHLKMS